MSDQSPTILAVSVGNTRVRLGLISRVGGEGGQSEVENARSVSPEDAPKAALELAEQARAVVLSSVNDPVADPLAASLSAHEVLRVQREVPIPLTHTLSDASTLGQDRALNALAAFVRVQQACVVIDAGTAITIDFVDGEGVFHGGVIIPGAQMMLDALSQRTSALPRVSIEDLPDPLEPFGKDTPGAMLLGAVTAARGAVRHACERYAEFYGAFAQVIATGGDALTLFREDELVEAIVPDLVLLGIDEAFRKALQADEPS